MSYIGYVRNKYREEARKHAINRNIDVSVTIDENGHEVEDPLWDAYRHTFASAAMTQDYSSFAASMAGSLQELIGQVYPGKHPDGTAKEPQSTEERNMDFWNNAVGRTIGENSNTRDEIDAWVFQVLFSGVLIIDYKTDTRNYFQAVIPAGGGDGLDDAQAALDGTENDSSQEPVDSSQEPVDSSQEPVDSSQEPVDSSQETENDSQNTQNSEENQNSSQNSGTIYQSPDNTGQTTNPTVFKGGGPFSRVVAAKFSRSVLFEFRFIRDDGVTITPDLEENLEIALYDPTGTPLCTCYSPSLTFREEKPGLVASFNYVDDHYRLKLELQPTYELTGLSAQNLECILMTRGSKTLETVYDRAYYPEKTATLIAPGRHTITLPYWYQTIQFNHPTLKKTEKVITQYSSIPYRAEVEVIGAQPLAYFNMALLGVVWNPLPDLSGWHGTYDIRDVCVGGILMAPFQYQEKLTQPTGEPANHQDQHYILYEDVIVKLSLSACPSGWNALSVALASDFGFSYQLPYIPPGGDMVDVSHPISDFGKNMAGKAFTITGDLLWSGGDFTYSTGNNPYYLNQNATMVESPVMDFDLILFKPLPE
jgi:hypothetical protein